MSLSVEIAKPLMPDNSGDFITMSSAHVIWITLKICASAALRENPREMPFRERTLGRRGKCAVLPAPIVPMTMRNTGAGTTTTAGAVNTADSPARSHSRNRALARRRNRIERLPTSCKRNQKQSMLRHRASSRQSKRRRADDGATARDESVPTRCRNDR